VTLEKEAGVWLRLFTAHIHLTFFPGAVVLFSPTLDDVSKMIKANIYFATLPRVFQLPLSCFFLTCRRHPRFRFCIPFPPLSRWEPPPRSRCFCLRAWRSTHPGRTTNLRELTS